tara:strand:+ start:150 stop:347 length:198 start_codon:yes stop_codon:yes gene_type:complete
MWDVALADQLGTTPWDVRENATLWDVMRLKLWTAGKNAGVKVQQQRQRAEQQRNRSVNRRMPRRR